LPRDPEIGDPRGKHLIILRLNPRVPDLHPLLHFEYREFQTQARYNNEIEKYDPKVHHISDYFTFSHENEKILRDMFEFFADDYLYLIGKGSDDKPSLHEYLHTVNRHLSLDFETYSERERDGADCSCGCKHFLKLTGKLGADRGACAKPVSPRAGLLTFEHQGCEQFEGLNSV
jgi:hypothetical protein